MSASLTLSVRFSRVVDGDTIEVLTDSDDRMKIRLLDVWCPEDWTEAGRLATANVTRLVDELLSINESRKVEVTIKFGSKFKSLLLNFMSTITFDRIVGVVFINGVSLNDEIVRRGYGQVTKPKASKNENRQ